MDELRAIFNEIGFSPKDERLPEAVIYSLGRTFSLLARRLAAVYKRFSLTPASFNLLMLLKHGQDPDRFTQQELGDRLVVSASDMTGLIDRLEEKGWVKRCPGKDRRCKILEITAKGSKVLDEVWPHHVEEVRQLAAVLEEGRARELVRSLLRLRRALQA